MSIPTNRRQAEAAGFTVDNTCYPWLAYKGPRFRPTEAHRIDTDKEAQRDELAEKLRQYENLKGQGWFHPDIVADLRSRLAAAEGRQTQ